MGMKMTCKEATDLSSRDERKREKWRQTRQIMNSLKISCLMTYVLSSIDGHRRLRGDVLG